VSGQLSGFENNHTKPNRPAAPDRSGLTGGFDKISKKTKAAEA
jgi:hypothetical protein